MTNASVYSEAVEPSRYGVFDWQYIVKIGDKTGKIQFNHSRPENLGKSLEVLLNEILDNKLTKDPPSIN